MIKQYELKGFEVREYEELESTNTLATCLPREQLKDKTVILAHRQTHGRGQVGNSWESEPDKNILMSIVFCPERYEAYRQFAVSMVIALGAYDFLKRYVKGVSVKWPNDVYVGAQKIAGILIEHTIRGRYIDYSVCGIGVNINQKEFFSDAPNPVSLVQLTGTELSIGAALEELLECVGRRYAQMENYEKLEQDFLAALYRKEGSYNWQDEKESFRASIEGVDEYGRLVLRRESGEEKVYGFKEVVYK